MGVLALMLFSAAFVPGLAAEPEQDVRSSQIDLRDDTPIEVLSVPGDTVTLRLDTRLTHRYGPADNVSIELRAIDSDTELLADTRVESVGTITGDREVSVPVNLSLDREGDYRIKTLVYADDERVTTGVREIHGLGSLPPDYARSPVEFQRFEESGESLPSLSYAIENDDANRTTLNVSAALVNNGNSEAGDVSVRMRARQAESNVVADSQTVRVGSIEPGHTVGPSVRLSVPAGYNYWMDAILVKDGVVIGTASDPANLDPTRTLSENESERSVDFEAGDFERTDVADDAETSTPYSDGSGPGFGAGLALLALVGTGLLAGRRTSHE